MLDVNVTNTFYPPPPPIYPTFTSYMYPSPPPPRLTWPLFILSYPPPPPSPNNTPSVSLTNPASYPTCGCSLQSSGWTALIRASQYGYPEIVQALLAAAGIDVNHADVSIFPLTTSHVIVGVSMGEVYLSFPLQGGLTLELMSYHPLTSKMYPNTRGKTLY